MHPSPQAIDTRTPMHDAFDSSFPLDQAHGLRQMFAHNRVRFVPVVANPHMAFGGVMLERLCTAFGEQGSHVLVIDAADRSPAPKEMAVLELSECIETLSTQVSYLAARGLPVRYVDAQGCTASFLQAASDAAPHADVVLVHANESDLCRLFVRSGARPLLLADDRPSSVTHAYAAMKLLTKRAGLVVHDLLLCAAPTSPRVERIAVQLATCADDFLGAVLRDWLHVDPACDARDPAPPALRRWARDVLQQTGSGFMPLAGATHADAAQYALN
jgi:flagellar biosynthesis protein FlhG